MRGKSVGLIWSALLAGCLLILSACGGSSGMSSTSTSTTSSSSTQNGTVSAVISDDPAEDWAAVDVKVLSIALVPQGGGTPVTIYTAPNPAPSINLVQLDQLGEILGNVPVPAGTYTSAVITISGNPGDVSLVVSANPEVWFRRHCGRNYPEQPNPDHGREGEQWQPDGAGDD